MERYGFINYVNSKTEKDSVLEFLKNEYYTELKPGIHGVGVFALKDIPKGVDPLPTFKHPLSSNGSKWYQATFRNNELQGIHSNVIQYHATRVFHPRDVIVITLNNELHKLMYLNHSESNNLDKDESNISGLITNRKIREGEELVQNYHHFEHWESLIDE